MIQVRTTKCTVGSRTFLPTAFFGGARLPVLRKTSASLLMVSFVWPVCGRALQHPSQGSAAGKSFAHQEYTQVLVSNLNWETGWQTVKVSWVLGTGSTVPRRWASPRHGQVDHSIFPSCVCRCVRG